MTQTATRAVQFPASGERAPLLAGELWLPPGARPFAGVVVTHPHPQRGGNMDNNVVMALCTGLQRAGIAALRFNFRGVGKSQGVSSGGTEEIPDVLGALAFLAEQPEIRGERVGLAGYSFGARMSLAALPQAPTIRALLAVAPPLREALPAAERPTCPFLALVGDRDGLVAEGVERYAGYLPKPEQLRVVAGTDHFWWGFEDVIIESAQAFFAQHLGTVEG
jgi:hypothetical protein